MKTQPTVGRHVTSVVVISYSHSLLNPVIVQGIGVMLHHCIAMVIDSMAVYRCFQDDCPKSKLKDIHVQGYT